MDIVKDILLVNPNYNEKEIFNKNAHLPIGLAYIAQSVEDNLYTYEICDLTVQKDEYLWELLSKNKYKYIGFGMMSFNVEKTYEIIHKVKQMYPFIKVIIGGPHVIAAKEKIFKECTSVDILVRGEGEELIIEILKELPLENIKGIYYKKSDGNIFKNEYRGYLKDFNNISFPKYNKFNLDLYPKYMILSSSRGCPYKCTFCGAPEFLGKKWRKRESNKIFEEFYYWYKKGYRNFKFEDSLFSADKKRIFEFCEEVIKLGDKEVSFAVDGARCDHFNFSLLDIMKKAGFITLVFGIESANEHVLKNFKKGETFKQIEETISIANELNFDIGMFFIIGGPDETIEDVQRSFEFALKYENTSFVYFFELTPIKGTSYYNYAIKQKYISENTPYPSGNFGFSNFATYGNNKMTKDEMSEMLNQARLIEKKVRDNFQKYRYFQKSRQKNIENLMKLNTINLEKIRKIPTHITDEEKLKLYTFAFNLSENSNVVEIGSYLGASAYVLALGIQDSLSKVICIDTWDNDAMTEGSKDTYDDFIKNTQKFSNIIFPIRGYSYEVVNRVKELTNSKIDLLFIDGDHSYEGVKKDWDLYSPMLHSGSMVIFHDVGWAEGIKRVIREDVKPFVSKDSNFELPNMYWALIK